MDYTNYPNSDQHPSAHDYEQLEIIYAHLDSTTTVSIAKAARRALPAMNQINFSERTQWGKRIHGSCTQGISVYKLDFGRGHKVFTFVIWTQPE